MKKNFNWMKWLKNLDDSEFSYYLKNKDKLYNSPDHIDERNLDLLKNIDKVVEIHKDLKKDKRVRRYVFSFAVYAAIFLVFFITGFIYFKYFKINLNKCSVTVIKGNAYLYSNKTGNKKAIKNKYKLSEYVNLLTDHDSQVNIDIGNKTSFLLNQNSDLIIKELFKKDSIEKTTFFLNYGHAIINSKKLNKGSFFKVETNLLTAEIIGTNYEIYAEKNEKTFLMVNEGTVYANLIIDLKMKLKYIESNAPKLYDEINKIINTKIVLLKNERLLITGSQVISSRDNIIKIIDDINIYISKIKKNGLSIELTSDLVKNKKDQILKIMNNLINKVKIIDEKKFKKEESKDNDSQNINKIERNSLNIISPGFNYYERTPVLQYNINNEKNIKMIYLNNKIININNNEIIKDAVTGFNNLKIIFNDNGANKEKKVDFFLNNLKLSFFDDFNRADSISIGSGWKENRLINNSIMSIRDNSLIGTGSENRENFSSIMKNFDSNKNKKIIEKIDVNYLKKNENVIELGIESSSCTIMARLIKTEKRYRIKIFDFNFKNKFTKMITDDSDYFDIDFTKKISFIFYKSNNYFGALLISDNKIINKVENLNYNSIEHISNYNKVRINYMPYDNTHDNNILISADNYYFFTE